MLEVHKINESFSYLSGTKEEILKTYKFLRIFDPSAKYNKLVKIGLAKPYKDFGSIQNGVLLVNNGHLPLIFGKSFEEEDTETANKIEEFVDSLPLPFKPYDYQINAVKTAMLKKKCLLKSCTSCLDPNTEIEVDIPNYTEDEIRDILNN